MLGKGGLRVGKGGFRLGKCWVKELLGMAELLRQLADLADFTDLWCLGVDHTVPHVCLTDRVRCCPCDFFPAALITVLSILLQVMVRLMRLLHTESMLLLLKLILNHFPWIWVVSCVRVLSWIWLLILLPRLLWKFLLQLLPLQVAPCVLHTLRKVLLL